MRPIDADALIEKCGGWYVEEGTESGFIGTLKNLLATMPTIQPEKAQLSHEGTTKDAISRQQALDAVGKYASVWMEYTDAMSKDEIAQIALNNAKSTMIRILKEQPTVQPEPKEGHWIEGEIYRDAIECNCSECGQLMTTAATVRMNFCPNCGAKMKGAQNG